MRVAQGSGVQSLDEDRVLGVLLGTAIGDAIGLPFEGLSPTRVAARLSRGPLRHSLVFGRGMVSDDTEHTALVARALIGFTATETARTRASPCVRARSALRGLSGWGGDVGRFTRGFARQLRRWILALPPGVGLATLRGALRSCLGFSPERSGVRSAGNGPAMRAALLGVVARDDQQLAALVRASTRVTHTDPRAEAGAWLVARWAREAGAPNDRIAAIAGELEPGELRDRVLTAISAATNADEFPRPDQRGISGFIVDTMPAVAYCWIRHREDPRAAIEAAIRLGGDTDTVAAIVGALIGAQLGAQRLPQDWIAGIRDWPIGVPHLRALAAALARDQAPPRLPWLGMLGRNLVMIAIVLAHQGLRALGR